METVIFRVLVASLGLYALDLLICGFVFGFGAFLGLCVATILIIRAYHRLVLQRPRKPAFQLARFGSAIYRMEVA